MPIYMIMPRYSHNYALFYQLLYSNLFTHRNTYAILREATSETYGLLIRLQHIYNFYCSMLLYYPFWMFMGFTLHFYIIFGTNLLSGGPTQIVVFLPISVFRRKGISNGVQTE